MKKQRKWILSALALAAVLTIAVLLYRNLSERYLPETTTGAVVVTETQTAANESAAPKTSAADFVVFDANNAEVRLSDRFGKPIVLNFWASWCGPCCSELPAFDAAAEQYADRVEFMMVNLTDGFSETVDSVQSFLEENGYTFPVYFDTNEDAANAYSIYSIPLSVFIRADGTVLDTHIGAMDEATLQSYLEQLLS